jgi:hypothetical protein
MIITNQKHHAILQIYVRHSLLVLPHYKNSFISHTIDRNEENRQECSWRLCDVVQNSANNIIACSQTKKSRFTLDMTQIQTVWVLVFFQLSSIA